MKFYGEANFQGNGQYERQANGEEPNNEAGGAIFNGGKMEVDACYGEDVAVLRLNSIATRCWP